MLWDPGSVEKKDETEGSENVPVTPILVPLQNKPPTVEKSVPVLVPDVQDLKDQFQQQQNMLTQIKETLKQNESQFSSKGKQVEVYANKLSQIRARSKNTQGRKPTTANPSSPKMQKKLSKENLEKLKTTEEDVKPSSDSYSKNRKGKVSELKKCLEENKIKFEQRTGKEQYDAKKIESLVEQLKAQLEERDKTIQDLQKNIEEPSPKLEFSQKLKPKVAAKTTQTTQEEGNKNSTEIITLQNKIHKLEANVLDLEENVEEKESVIKARTQALTLVSHDLSLKKKNTVESLEETRQEMRTMQNNFLVVENKLKNELMDRENKLEKLGEKCKKLESTNFELSLKNAELQEKLVNLQSKLEADKNSMGQGRTDDKLDELTKKIGILTKELDDRNKSMIKMKIEHKNKIKNLNKTLETIKGTSDDKAEIVRLSNLVGELENIKTELENRVAELEDEKASEKKLKDQINELEVTIKKQNEDLTLHLKTILNLEKENFDLIQLNQEQRTSLDDLQKQMATMESAQDREKFQKLEEEYNKKLEELKGEHRKEIEMIECYYNSKGEGLDRKTLEEYRISTEMNNIHVEEQIELLIREKQQLLEKLKSLSGVSSTDSLTFEKMEHSDLREEAIFPLGEEVDLTPQNTRTFHLEKIIEDQQILISDLQKTISEEKEKVQNYASKISELEITIKNLEEANAILKQHVEIFEAPESGKSSKTNTNTKNRIKKIELELSQSKRTVEEQNDKLNELISKLKEKEELIEKYTEKIELFEKDDWDRQNHWKNTEDDIENVQELQKKCLSLENSLYELNEDCERLRKENIEIVHLLSEEKVKRRKLLEELEAKQQNAAENSLLEEKIQRMSQAVQDLEEKVNRLESNHHLVPGSGTERPEEWENKNLREKLEWTNVVLTSKETEVFTLQKLLEDRNSSIEVLEIDLKEYKNKFEEKEKELSNLRELLKIKEIELEKLSGNFEELLVMNQKAASNETQLKELLAKVKNMEEDIFKKEAELQDIKGILAEKNLDMANLQNRLEEVNSDLTYSYQEHLENMKKCLQDKESQYDILLAQKNYLESVNQALINEKEDIHNQKIEIANEKERLKNVLLEKEKLLAELREKLENMEKGAEKNKEMEDLKIKLKKVAANLKKKAQNETDLLKRVKEMEDEVIKAKEVEEKWEVEKIEKEKVQNELLAALAEKAALESDKTALVHEFDNFKCTYECQKKELEKQIWILEENCNQLKAIERDYKDKIANLESKTAELLHLYENATSGLREYEETQTEKESVLKKLGKITEQYEELKFKYEQNLLEKSELQKQLDDLTGAHQASLSQKSSLDAKIQENYAVIESLENELKKAQDQIKVVEEKLFHSEDRRLSLENKNEEMCKKIMENSENLITIDDLSLRVDELVKSEKFLQNCVNNLESENTELKLAFDQIQTEKFGLDKELKEAFDKINLLSEELKEVRNSDAEKNNLIRKLTEETEKLKAENKRILSEFQKLNQDYEQFEVDFKENLENSQNIEKSLRHRIEELVNENASLIEKYNLLSETHKEAPHEPGKDGEDKKPKKKKSVTFRTDEVEYIKDLKNQLHNYDASLKQANEEIENLKAEIFRERLRNEVTSVLVEAQEKVESLRSTPEKRLEVTEPLIEPVQQKVVASNPEERKFDANAFFGNEADDPFLEMKNAESQISEFDSLMWDDGWGSEGHLEAEYLSGKLVENEKLGSDYEQRIKTLETDVKVLQEENERLKKEVQEQTAKYAKALKKLKELKIAYEKVQAETAKPQNSSGFGDLDAAIVDELKSQIESMETKEKELLKNLENAKLEKEALLKRIEVLNAGNEKFMEMKERQDNEVEIWQRKNNELLKEITELRQQLINPQILDDNAVIAENRELKNKIEALEWKNCELNELLEEKQELLEGKSETNEVAKVIEEKSQLQKEIDELNNVKERLEKKLSEEEKKNTLTVGELNDQLTALASENETLQDILGKMKKAADDAKKDQKQESKIFDYFKSSPADDSFVIASTETKQKANPDEKIIELENLLKHKEDELTQSIQTCEELQSFREKIETEMRIKDELFVKFQTEKENEIARLSESIAELENLIRLKELEMVEVKQLAGNEVENLLKKIQELENSSKLKDQFETVDLNSPNEMEVKTLRQRVFDLENILRQRENEFQQFQQTKMVEIENLRQRLFELEDSARRREDELRQEENELEAARRKIIEIEEFARFKENELYQVHSVNENLQTRIFELENLHKGDQQFENMLAFKDVELQQKTIELENLSQKMNQLENVVRMKDEEIGVLMSRLNELEKSYNDSKLEIERLLNEEKLNVEEKFVEPFQENMKIPIAFEVEALARVLDEEKQKSENLQYELNEKEHALALKNAEIESLNRKLLEVKEKLKEVEEEKGKQAEEKAKLELIMSELQKEVENLNLQLSVTQKEVEESQNVKDEKTTVLESRLFEMETELSELKERGRLEVEELKNKMEENTKYYEEIIKEKKEGQEKLEEMTKKLEKEKKKLEKDVERLKQDLLSKEKDIESLGLSLAEERSQALDLRQKLEVWQAEAKDLKETLAHMQEEIGHFRNFEKQLKELRVTHMKESGSNVQVTSEGHPDLSGWTENELAELSTRLQSDLDTALYMLHQRDVRCDELTFELMQLLEERDTLQLRLSTALRINEELRALGKGNGYSNVSNQNLQESKDLVDQSNDRQTEKSRESDENFRLLANKISELHSVSYLRDKNIKDESVQRHKEQMNLLSRVSDSDIALGRDGQSSNWVKGKTNPKVMHI